MGQNNIKREEGERKNIIINYVFPQNDRELAFGIYEPDFSISHTYIGRFLDKCLPEKKIILVINFSSVQLQVFSGAKEAMKRKLWHPHLSAVQVIYLP